MYYRDLLQICLFKSPCFELISKKKRHHVLDGQKKKNLAKGQICLEKNSTHVASTRAVFEVEREGWGGGWGVGEGWGGGEVGVGGG